MRAVLLSSKPLRSPRPTQRIRARRRRALGLVAGCLLPIGCSAAPRRAQDVAAEPAPGQEAQHPSGVKVESGHWFGEVKTHVAIPILQKSFFWDGNGEVDNAGVGLRAFRGLGDGWALGMGFVAANWFLSGNDVQSGEIEAVLRCYPFSGSHFFIDGNTGYQQATDAIPPGGTEWNFCFGFGPGYEIPLEDGMSLILAANYHHISNALGRQSPHNPSQNEARLWIGFAWNF
ncbi:MAG: hypothetical protein H6838_02170 [Planctomycetes bacterium]|nr:hypothetical protein [Planctomycetota bacterium]MCB9884265.1 hypothetical protein [Planctomycetota bacterium]